MWCLILSVLMVALLAWTFVNPAQRTIDDPLSILNEAFAEGNEQTRIKACTSFAMNLKSSSTDPVVVEWANEICVGCTRSNGHIIRDKVDIAQNVIAICLRLGLPIEELEPKLSRWK